MKIKTSELNERALDWAVTMIEKPEACEYGVDDWLNQRRHTVKDGEYVYRWHQSWMQAGPIIEREQLLFHGSTSNGYHCWSNFPPYASGDGPSHLIAAMRAYVASRLGDEVEIPEELA